MLAESMGDTPATLEEARALLDECEARYERLVERSPDVIYRVQLRPEPRIEYMNSAGERVFGYPLDTLIGAGLDFLLDILPDPGDQAALRDVAAGRGYHPVAMRHYKRADGEMIWVEIHNIPVYDDAGNLVAQEGTIRDVTERERILAELRTSEERQRSITESLPDLVMRVDSEGTCYERVPTVSRQPAAPFLGKRIDQVPSEASATARESLSLALSGKHSSFRCVVDVQGIERNYEVRLVPTGSEQLLAFLRDITGEVWAEGEDARRAARDTLETTVEQQIGIRNPYSLTFREFAVLHLVAQGAADKQIANDLGIALSTVNKHVSNILGKMGASSRTEAGVRAVQEGLVYTG